MVPEKKKLKIVLRSTFIHEVQLAKAKLASNGIKSFIVDEHITYTIGTAFIEDYKLTVNESDFNKAHTILSLFKT
jgi:hypothetical protein